MFENQTEDIPQTMAKYLGMPFKGLFGNTIHLKVLEEIVADPYRKWRIIDLQRIINASNLKGKETKDSSPTIKKALEALADLDFLENISPDSQHPLYEVDLRSKRLLALTFLAYAIGDDLDRTEVMDTAIKEYCAESIGTGYIDFQQVVREVGSYSILKEDRTAQLMDYAATDMQIRGIRA